MNLTINPRINRPADAPPTASLRDWRKKKEVDTHTADVQAGLDKLQVPAGYTVKQGGAGKEMAEQFMQIFMALGTSVVLMYLLMALLFDSLFFPLIVILSLPLAVVGAFGLLTLTGNTCLLQFCSASRTQKYTAASTAGAKRVSASPGSTSSADLSRDLARCASSAAAMPRSASDGG